MNSKKAAKNLTELIPEQMFPSLCGMLLQNIENIGLGSFTKSDLEALIFFLIDQNRDRSFTLNDYDWCRLLKIKPSKLRSLQEYSSVKYKTIDKNRSNFILLIEELSRKNIIIKDLENGILTFSIDDYHVLFFLKSLVDESGYTLEPGRNIKNVEISYIAFAHVIEQICNQFEIDYSEMIMDLQQSLKKDHANTEDLKAYINKGDSFAKNTIELSKNISKSTLSSFFSKIPFWLAEHGELFS